MHAAQSAQSTGCQPVFTDVRNDDLPVVSDDYPDDLSAAVDQQSNLAADFTRQTADVLGEFERDDVFGRNASAVKFFESAQLVGFQPAGITIQPFHLPAI